MSAVAVGSRAGAPVVSGALWSRGLAAVLAAQFLWAMADNALLFGALALLRREDYAPWTAPLLQEFFVGAYILLAPFVGPFADSLPKGRVMLLANGVKLLGSHGMWSRSGRPERARSTMRAGDVPAETPLHAVAGCGSS